jgi:hypothetical protein
MRRAFGWIRRAAGAAWGAARSIPGWLVAGIAAFLALAVAGGLTTTPYDNYVRLANALVHGHVWIDWPGPCSDALAYRGRHYVIEAPFPAILMLPAAMLWGADVNQALYSAALGALAVGAGWELARRAGVPSVTRIWLCGFLLLGTDLFWCAMYGDVWFIAHVSAVAFTLLALVELLGERRGWLVALYAICALESRFSLVLALPVYAAWLAFDDAARGRLAADARRRLVHFGATLVPFAVLWIGYNLARWGVPYDSGYAAWYHQDEVGEPTGLPFRLTNLPYQLYSFFVRLPAFIPYAPYVVPTYNGIALTWTSPALVLAFFAREPRRIVILAWAATILVALPNFLYYVNGFVQFGMRHALDFEPFLFLLMALALRGGIRPIGMALCAWSIAVGIWGVWFWETFYRPMIPRVCG